MPSAEKITDFAMHALREQDHASTRGFRSTSQHRSLPAQPAWKTTGGWKNHRRQLRHRPPHRDLRRRPRQPRRCHPPAPIPTGLPRQPQLIEAAGGRGARAPSSISTPPTASKRSPATLRSAIEARWHCTTIDGLVNNAGFALPAPLAETTEEQFDRAPAGAAEALLPYPAAAAADRRRRRDRQFATSSSALPNGVSAGLLGLREDEGRPRDPDSLHGEGAGAARDRRQRGRPRPDLHPPRRRRLREVPRTDPAAGRAHRARAARRGRRRRQGDRRPLFRRLSPGSPASRSRSRGGFDLEEARAAAASATDVMPRGARRSASTSPPRGRPESPSNTTFPPS